MGMEDKINELIEFAKKEKGDLIDEKIPYIADDKNFVKWAKQKGIHDVDGQVRDLAVSILEKTSADVSDVGRDLLELIKNDQNIYVQYRSAFTLAGHNLYGNSKEILKTLKKAKLDKAVSEIASKYLEKYKRSKK